MKKSFLGILAVGLASTLTMQAQASTPYIDNEAAALQREAPNLNHQALVSALEAYNCATQSGINDSGHILTIIDYSKPSSEKRLFTFDLARHRLLFNTLVAHGKNSGGLMATRFSNQPESRASSIGLFVTGETYFGRDGYSLRLSGLDHGFNDMARDRAVVMHGANYVSSEFVKEHGRLGLSWGCPAVPRQMVKPIINTIKGGTLVFAYYPQRTFMHESKYLHCAAANMNAASMSS